MTTFGDSPFITTREQQVGAEPPAEEAEEEGAEVAPDVTEPTEPAPAESPWQESTEENSYGA